MDERAGRIVQRPRPSCVNCQRTKKKCDRERPKCSLCQRHGRDCRYPDILTENAPTSNDPSLPESSASAVSTVDNDFPAVYFLDSVLFQRSLRQLSQPTFALHDSIQAYVGTLDAATESLSSYFGFVHPWIPFLSKRNFMETVISPLAPSRPSHKLLIAAMKLVAFAPSDACRRTAPYKSIKESLSQAEFAGLVDFRIFQALVLLAVYELGHTILPEAYMTIGYCLRYGIALGISRYIEPDSQITLCDLDSEEKRRSWWVILLLDRFISIGFSGRPTLTQDPGSASLLPADDSLWANSAETKFSPHRLSDPTEKMGRFCLTAQATILLGRVLHVIHYSPESEQAQPSQIQVLDNTLEALTRVALEEGRSRGVGVCSPTTVCYSARFLLHDRERRGTPPPVGPAMFEETVADSMLRLAHSVGPTGTCGTEEISPFCLEAMYRAGIYYARRHLHAPSSVWLDAVTDIKNALHIMSYRWRVAESYRSMLEARIVSGILV